MCRTRQGQTGGTLSFAVVKEGGLVQLGPFGWQPGDITGCSLGSSILEHKGYWWALPTGVYRVSTQRVLLAHSRCSAWLRVPCPAVGTQFLTFVLGDDG